MQLYPIKTIYLIRHGETDQNLSGIIQGSSINSTLNATGQRQARAFYQQYRHVAFDKVYVTELHRTHQSVADFINDGIPLEVLPQFNEIHWGTLEGINIKSDSGAQYFEMLSQWSAGNTNFAKPGGESPNQVRQRMQDGLNYLLAKPDEHTILVCLHGRALRILLTIITGTPLAAMDQFEHRNLGLYIVQYQAGRFEIVERNVYAQI
jgi:probable phosphoglycerate mutase